MSSGYWGRVGFDVFRKASGRRCFDDAMMHKNVGIP